MTDKRIFWHSAIIGIAFALPLNGFAQTLIESEPGGTRVTRTIRIGEDGGQQIEESITIRVDGSDVAIPYVADGEGGGPRFVAQQIGGGAGNMMMLNAGGDSFIWNSAFGDELGLSEEQKTELQKVVDEMRTQRFQANPGERMNLNDVRDQMRQRMDTMRTRVGEVLKPEQQARLRELSFQATGGLDSPFLNERMFEFTDLSDAQKEQIRKITEERNAEAVGTLRDGGAREMLGQLRTPEGRAQLAAENEARNKKYTEQIKAVLTDEQRAKAEKLTAEAPALRERIGASLGQARQQGQRGQQQGQSVQGRRTTAPPPIFTPGDGSWKPGDGAPVKNRERTGEFPLEDEE